MIERYLQQHPGPWAPGAASSSNAAVTGQMEPAELSLHEGLRRGSCLRRLETFLEINDVLVPELGYGSDWKA